MNRRFDSDFLRKVVLFIYYSGLVGIEATLSIYSASVNPPDAPYSQLLSGNTLFDTVYATFNTSGVLAIGGILLAAGAIFALRSAPDPEEIKDEFENIREKIKSKPLPFLSGKGKKKKKEKDNDQGYGVPVAPSVPVYVPSDLPTYNPTTAKPITFSFDVTDTYTNKRHVQEDDYTSNLIGPTLGLGATPGPPYSKSGKKKIFVNVDYPFSSSGRQPTTSQVIEPIYNEVSQTLTNALSGQFDYSDRASQRRKDVVSVDNDVTNDVQDNYNDGEEEEEEYQDENESESDPKYYPTMPPIYPSVKRKPEGRSLKNSRIGSRPQSSRTSSRQMRMEDGGHSSNRGRGSSFPTKKSYYPIRHPKWRHHQTRSKMKTNHHQSSSSKKKNNNQSSSSTFNFFDTSRFF